MLHNKVNLMMSYCIPFHKIRNTDISIVGGKNASLGEMIFSLHSKGIAVPEGFAINAKAYQSFLLENNLEKALNEHLSKLDALSLSNLHEIGLACREVMASGSIPEAIENEIISFYRSLSSSNEDMSVAVRSSATAEDLPEASFAGQHDSFLNIKGERELLETVKRCYISLFNDRAIKYRMDNGFEHMNVLLSVGIQKMVRSDLGAAGVCFTIEPENGAQNIMYMTGAWGLGENVVQGAVSPDEFYVFKPALQENKKSVFYQKTGAKEFKMVYDVADFANRPVKNIPTTHEEQVSLVLTNDEAEKLAKWCFIIEQHYQMPMDIEWAKDGLSNELYIVQARPETVHRSESKASIKEYKLKSTSKLLCKGKAVGKAIASGRAVIVNSLADAFKVQQGDIIVADITNPDWNALLRKAVSIVTNKGGRTSHASIVARELGIHAVVGTGNATEMISDGQIITVSCAQGDEGQIFEGKLDWDLQEISLQSFTETKTKPMFILADPDKAMSLAQLPNQGVGLLRMEFIISNAIRIHPMALAQFDQLADSNERKAIEAITGKYKNKKEYFIDRLRESVAMVAAAFYPKDVIVRMSDFKTNEYAQLIGGRLFEPEEENPMLGFRGASRYYHDKYREGFGMECEAMRQVRDELGLTNVKLMIPFCRTLEEGNKVLQVMKEYGLIKGKNGLEIYVMAEIPSNVILAEEFAKIFDGFSIGSNDLTQLTLGIDRDSSLIMDLFDEHNPAVLKMLEEVITKAKLAGVKIGLCGQAPSDHPDFAEFLVKMNIDTISFTPDSILRGINNIIQAEKNLVGK